MTIIYSSITREKAKQLRHRGYSFAEIAKRLKIAKSTASVWTNKVELNKDAQKQLTNWSLKGRLKSITYFQNKRLKEQRDNYKLAKSMFGSLGAGKNLSRLICSLLFWCEGNKNESCVRFTSSDPALIRVFLQSLRRGFLIEERKLRALIHLHEYHNEEEQKRFWYKITNIPIRQFNKSYRKPNTGKRRKENYPGCLAITYYDVRVARELTAIYNFLSRRGVG